MYTNIMYKKTKNSHWGERVYRAGHSHHGRFQWEPEVLYPSAHWPWDNVHYWCVAGAPSFLMILFFFLFVKETVRYACMSRKENMIYHLFRSRVVEQELLREICCEPSERNQCWFSGWMYHFHHQTGWLEDFVEDGTVHRWVDWCVARTINFRGSCLWKNSRPDPGVFCRLLL